MKTKLITSIRSLAKHLKRDEKAVRLYLADDRWPFSRKPSWPVADVPRMKAWQRDSLEQQPDGDDESAIQSLSKNPERVAKIKLIIERTTKLRLERELLAGKYLQRETVQADLVRRAAEARRTLEAITSLAPRLTGKPEGQVRALLAEHVSLVCGILSNGGQA